MESNSSKELVNSENYFIRISRGPQFRTKGGHIIALVALTSFISAVYCVANQDYFIAAFLLLVGIISFLIVLDIRVIEVDTRLHIIRDCKSLIWVRIGKWSRIQDFKSIYVTREIVVIGRDDESEYSTDTFHYYFVKLVDEEKKREIVLAECNNYYKAQHVAKRIANLTGLLYRDFLIRNSKRKYE